MSSRIATAASILSFGLSAAAGHEIAIATEHYAYNDPGKVAACANHLGTQALQRAIVPVPCRPFKPLFDTEERIDTFTKAAAGDLTNGASGGSQETVRSDAITYTLPTVTIFHKKVVAEQQQFNVADWIGEPLIAGVFGLSLLGVGLGLADMK